MPISIRNRLGCIRNKKTQESKKLYKLPKFIANLPTSFDLTDKFTFEIYDQGELGSCTANAIAEAYRFANAKQGNQNFNPSRLFIYFNERLIEGTIYDDSGAEISDGMKVINNTGVCAEEFYPYNITKYQEFPSADAYFNAWAHKSIEYYQVNQTPNIIKSALVNSDPIVFGISVYESFESDAVEQTGIVPMPKDQEQQIGGHAILLVGYDDTKQLWKFRNSWGSGWGDKGYGYLPYDYLNSSNDLASDFYVVQRVSA